MWMTAPALALAALLQLTQEQAPPSEPPAPAAAEAPAPTDKASEERMLSRITLKDGQVLRGVVVRQDERVLVVELADGERMELSVRLVKSITLEDNAKVGDNGEIWFQDPNRTRYLYAPSAMMLRKGEGYFSQKQLLFSSVNYGLTDYLTVQAGAVLPAWLTSGGFNFIGGVKVGGSVTDRLHLAAGAQVLTMPGSSWIGTAGLLFGTTTYGTPDAHLSLGVGTPVVISGGLGQELFPRDVILTVSGNVRVGQRVALITENWALPTLLYRNGALPMANSLAARIFGEQWAVDIGVIRVAQVPIPIPWLDFSYNFG